VVLNNNNLGLNNQANQYALWSLTSSEAILREIFLPQNSFRRHIVFFIGYYSAYVPFKKAIIDLQVNVYEKAFFTPDDENEYTFFSRIHFSKRIYTVKSCRVKDVGQKKASWKKPF